MLKNEKDQHLAEANKNPARGFLPRWMRIYSATEYTGLSRSLLYELMAAGKIRSHRVGGARVLDRESLDEFIASRPAN